MITTAALAIVQLATRIVELRLAHYEANPELLQQDAENAALWGAWVQRLMQAVDKLFEAIDPDE